MNLITLYQFKRYKKLDLTVTTDDDRLLAEIANATDAIEAYKDRHYDPRIETRRYKVPSNGASAFGVFDVSLMAASGKTPKLRLNEDLLEVLTLKNGNGDEILAANYEAEPVGSSPKYAVRLIDENWYGGDDDRIELKAIWGTHYKYSQAWVDSLDTVLDTGGISASATSMTVADADGVAGDLQMMRFQPGQLLRLGSEFCLALTTNTTSNQVGLARGVNGSTAAAHAAGTKIEIWRPAGHIVQAALRLTAWMWSQKDVDVYDKTYNVGTGVATTPSAIPVDVERMLGARRAR